MSDIVCMRIFINFCTPGFLKDLALSTITLKTIRGVG